MASISLQSYICPSFPPKMQFYVHCRSIAIFRKTKLFSVKQVCAEAVLRACKESVPRELYSIRKLDLTKQNVDMVLNDVRPYLIADGGNVDVISVEDGVVSLSLQGACGNCPSSTTTMKMGIERVLKEKFGDAIRDVRQLDEEIRRQTTVEVNGHLDLLRPTIKNYGSVEVVSVDGGVCRVKYVGPESIGSGVKAAIKDKFPDILNIILSS